MPAAFRRRALRRLPAVAALAALAASVAVPAFSAEQPEREDNAFLTHVSQAPQVRYYLSHPQDAPESFRAQLGQTRTPASASAPTASVPVGPAGARFNLDDTGLSQNEESVAVCESKQNIVVSATNDYRGLLDPEGNFTGWYLSTDGGKSVAKEGLMPSVDLNGTQTPSGGDPVVAADDKCNLYGASLAYDANDPFGAHPNGVAMYKTTPGALQSSGCGDATSPTGSPILSDPDCWDAAVASQTVGGTSGHFYDKEWLAVGDTGDGEHVWITYSDFTNSDTPLSFSKAQVYAVRCDENLANCTAPILISENDSDVAFSYVTIGPDGRTYVTWAGIQGELTNQPQTFFPRMRIAEPGSTDFGPIRTVTTLRNAIGFTTKLHAADFRMATGPKNAVKMVNGHAREFIVYDECVHRLLGSICEEPRIQLAYSDDDGVSWKFKRVSAGGDNYFPTLAVDPDTGLLAVAWYTNRFDVFHHRQDLELVSVDPATVKVTLRKRVTSLSNEPDADFLLGGAFIGDYIQVAAAGGRAYVAYNASYVPMPLLAEGPPEYQQDNYVSIRKLT